jgi:hydrogenase nickel incorporation protein HypB
MCDTCGCSNPDNPRISFPGELSHDHARAHGHGHDHTLAPITIGADVLAKNKQLAQANRAFFDRHGLHAVNIMSSPGSGKTTVVESLARRFGDAMAVVIGDIQTHRDAERVIRAGSRSVQIETNGACHLDAHAVAHALQRLDLEGCKLLVIENVGNLVCPSSYDLGEHEKIAMLSLPEGDDKVLKYPSLFHRADVLLINKIDLAPYMEFAVNKVVNECNSLNRHIIHFSISAKTGAGMDAFCEYLMADAGTGRG